MKELSEIIRARRAAPGIPFALATVVLVQGSSYRKPGARMLISLQGRVEGSVSGGCLEKDVISRGRAIILEAQDEQVALAVYDTTDLDDMAFGTSLGCEGRIEILIQLLQAHAEWEFAARVEGAVRDQRPFVLATAYRGAKGVLGKSFEADDLPREFEGALAIEFDAVMKGKKPRSCQLGEADFLVERIAPPTHLVIFGGGDDVPPLVRLAKELGHHVTVVDRRLDFAERERFPGADAVLHAKPHEVLALNLLDADSLAVIMNHHFETDAELLATLVRQPLAYLGMLGPRKRTLKILREAQEQGAIFTPLNLEKLHAPVGLDLGSDNPEQIALCILAEIQAVLSGRSGVHLRNTIGRFDELFLSPQLAIA